MTHKEIVRNFAVDKDGATPIYEQLRVRLEQFIADSPPGTRIAPERDMAEALEVSRNTVKAAVEDLAERNLLTRHGRRGTFTNPQGGALRLGSEKLHPMNLHGLFVAPPPGGELKILLFENYPPQRRFWENAVDKFNGRHAFSARAHIEYLPADISGPEILGYAANRQADIMQLNPDSGMPSELLRPLPSDIGSFMDDPVLSWSKCFEGAPGFAKRCLPVHFNFWGVFYNRTLAEICGISGLEESLRKPDIFAVLRELRKKLPSEFELCTEPCDLLLSRGWVPGHTRDVLLDDIRLLAGLRDENIIKPLSLSDWTARMRELAEGRQLLLFGWSNLALNFFSSDDAVIAFTPLAPVSGRFSLNGGSFMGISSKSRYPDKAEDFLRFLLEEDIQRDIFNMMQSSPLSRRSAAFMSERFGNWTEKECAGLLGNVRVFKHSFWSHLIGSWLSGAVLDVMQGRLSPEAALDLVHAPENGEKWTMANTGR
ncbi:MAG: hypothetical protein A2X49_15935 [Lentisphaerae bacterium GWF2_52_8]|nr:MAG: hypothetical protein A2X49_15935 [Lentisphaerae bacterium GWF2_52_8]